MDVQYFKPHQQRVLEEKVELDMKLQKLENFLEGEVYPTLPEAERLRLRRQFCYMRDYSNVLRERIAAFTS
jgi:hypothetical protein